MAMGPVVLFTVNTGGVLDDEAEEDALVDIFHVRNLGDATVLSGLLDVVLFALRCPGSKNQCAGCFTLLGAHGRIRRDGGTAVDGSAAAEHGYTDCCRGSKCHDVLFHVVCFLGLVIN